MTKRFKAGASARYVSEAALSISLLAFAGAAMAVPGYVTFGPNGAVVNAAGQCWKTGDWTPDKAVSPCDPVARAAEAVAPVSVTPAPPPAPIAAAPAPAPVVIEKVDLSTDVLFEFNKATLMPAGQQLLDEVAKNAQGANVEQVRIVGHADRIGSEKYNQDLSERRAQAVRDYFAQKGANPQSIQAEGKGESEPVTGNQCDKLGNKASPKLISCLQPDRRVEIELLGSRQAASGETPASAGAGASTAPGTTSGSGTGTTSSPSTGSSSSSTTK
jgi:OOP family OmpA-OmpF porin